MQTVIVRPGERFGRLTAIEFAYRKNSRRLWRFKCDCGNEHVTVLSYVRNGLTKSCGCLQRELSAQRRKGKFTHGMTGSPEYRAWYAIFKRCNNPKYEYYENYGGRGISVCERWLKFEDFYADMGARPSSDHSIDRIDNNGNYEPGNCRWATRIEQAENRRSTRVIALEETDISLAEFCRRFDINYFRTLQRINRGQPLEKSLWDKYGE